LSSSSKKKPGNSKEIDNRACSQKYSYRNAGVDIYKAGKTIELIKKPVFSTFTENVLNDLTSYAGLFRFDKERFEEPVMVSSTDGVGTKLLLSREMGIYDFIGQDLVGMCINDILCTGAVPLFFLDYIACGKLDPTRIETIVSSMAESCRICETALIGGEIAEMPGMYAEEDIDLAGFAVGVVEKKEILKPSLVSTGDLVLGIPSSGIHSNGFSLIRKIIRDKNLDLDKNYDFQSEGLQVKSLGEALLEPTRLYYNILKKLRSMNIKLNGIAHITGGGFYENINRIIPANTDAEINTGCWKVPGIFKFLQHCGEIDDREMFRVFNMGIGMVIVAEQQHALKIKSAFSSGKEKVIEMGVITEGKGKVILR
jgi:phosphoribosylformylglycinamidine cyclo-ligase